LLPSPCLHVQESLAVRIGQGLEFVTRESVAVLGTIVHTMAKSTGKDGARTT
jgi:hypothetical protein